MKTKLKNIYYKLLKLKSRVLYGRPVLVTMYHRVNNVVGEKLKHLTVDIETFEKQLCFFKENYQILRLSDNWNSLQKTGIVITFDDGYADNIINALPLLEKYQIPATIFVTTFNINNKKEFWWDRFELDYSNCEGQFYFPEIDEKVSKSEYSNEYISAYLHKLSNEEKESWLVKFEKLNNITFIDSDNFRSLSKEELDRLVAHPLIDIGIHTHNHYSFGELNYEEQKKEMHFSIKKLEELEVRYLKYLALPYGAYNLETLRVVDELGFMGMLLANNNFSNAKNKSSKKINRILLPNIKGNQLVSYMDRFDFKIW